MPSFRGYPYPRRAMQASCLALCLMMPAAAAYAHTASPTDLAVANRIAFGLSPSLVADRLGPAVDAAG